ncbi:MAG: carbon starvation protein A [Ignavibacteriales bacterium]|nr:carbon starvation protein A [Ignavibacteriales bacterium]
MNGIELLIIAIVFFGFGYIFYGKFLTKKLGIDNKISTPSHTMTDGVDYVPAKSPVLLGHHFASIAGAGPIIGPVIAAGFGWLPVYLWVLFGAVFIGGVHDYSSIIVSIRHHGKSIGYIIESYIGLSGKKLFLLFAWATLILVIAVFTIIVADTFKNIPSAGTSSILFMLLAVIFGFSIYRLKVPLWLATLFGVALLFLSIPLGNLFPIELDVLTWQLILFGYIFIASVVPVWILLQPRDYLNSFFLYALIFGGLIGVFFAAPEINIPSFATFELKNVGYLFPALFVTVACGAISGFHSLVGSGTTSKQLNKETDGKIVGYGGMLIEGLLAVLSLVAVASLVNKEFMDILITRGPVPAFSIGVANFLNAIPILNIPLNVGQTFTALAVSAFALTSLDTATRLARFTFTEFFEVQSKKENSILLKNRYFSTAVTVIIAAFLVISGQSMSIWPIFGSANQLLAALAFLAITVWSIKLKKGSLFVLIPMLFMFSITLTTLAMLIYTNLIATNYLLMIISLLLFSLAIVLGIKGYIVLTKN